MKTDYYYKKTEEQYWHGIDPISKEQFEFATDKKHINSITPCKKSYTNGYNDAEYMMGKKINELNAKIHELDIESCSWKDTAQFHYHGHYNWKKCTEMLVEAIQSQKGMGDAIDFYIKLKKENI